MSPLVSRVFNRAFQRKIDPGVDASGVNGSRNIRHQVLVGGLQLAEYRGNSTYGPSSSAPRPFFESWWREESSYSAGSSCQIRCPRLGNWDFAAMIQDMQKQGKNLPVEIRTSLNGRNFVTEFAGIIDHEYTNYHDGYVLLDGVSYARILANQKTTTIFQGMTTSQAVQQLVQQFAPGMRTDIDTFNTNVGAIYRETFAKASLNLSVWDLIESFALKDNADLHVEGDTLYYKKRPVDSPNNVLTIDPRVQPSYVWEWGKNILKLEEDHYALMSHEINVQVRGYDPRTDVVSNVSKSWNDQRIKNLAARLEIGEQLTKNMDAASQAKLQKTIDRQRAVHVGQASAAKMSAREQYVFDLLAPQNECNRVADQIMKDITEHEFIFNMTVLGNPSFTARQYHKLQGTGSRVRDQIYATKLLRTESVLPGQGKEGGYTTKFTIVNHAVAPMGTNLGM